MKWPCVSRSGADLVGYLNYIHPTACRFWASAKIAYLSNIARRLQSAALPAS